MVYEYVVSIELNTTDVSVIEQLRNMVLPVSMDYDIQVSDINITTGDVYINTNVTWLFRIF